VRKDDDLLAPIGLNLHFYGFMDTQNTNSPVMCWKYFKRYLRIYMMSCQIGFVLTNENEGGSSRVVASYSVPYILALLNPSRHRILRLLCHLRIKLLLLRLF